MEVSHLLGAYRKCLRKAKIVVVDAGRLGRMHRRSLQQGSDGTSSDLLRTHAKWEAKTNRELDAYAMERMGGWMPKKVERS